MQFQIFYRNGEPTLGFFLSLLLGVCLFAFSSSGFSRTVSGTGSTDLVVSEFSTLDFLQNYFIIPTFMQYLMNLLFSLFIGCFVVTIWYRGIFSFRRLRFISYVNWFRINHWHWLRRFGQLFNFFVLLRIGLVLGGIFSRYITQLVNKFLVETKKTLQSFSFACCLPRSSCKVLHNFCSCITCLLAKANSSSFFCLSAAISIRAWWLFSHLDFHE